MPLLADPGREFHVLDLAAPTLGQAVVADLGAAIDPTARAAYRDVSTGSGVPWTTPKPAATQIRRHTLDKS